MIKQKIIKKQIEERSLQKNNWGYDARIKFKELIKNIPTLSTKETEELFIKLRAGDKNAREKIINGNLRIVLYVLKAFYKDTDNQYLSLSFSWDDMINEGILGLIEAVKKYSPIPNIPFINYAILWIYQKMNKYLWKFRTIIKIPETQRNYFKKIKKHIPNIESDFNAIKDIDELSEETNISKKMISYLMTYEDNCNISKLYEDIEYKQTEDDSEILKPIIEEERRNELNKYLNVLNDNDKRFIMAAFNINREIDEEEKNRILSRYTPKNLAIRKMRVLNKIRNKLNLTTNKIKEKKK